MYGWEREAFQKQKFNFQEGGGGFVLEGAAYLETESLYWCYKRRGGGGGVKIFFTVFVGMCAVRCKHILWLVMQCF